MTSYSFPAFVLFGSALPICRIFRGCPEVVCIWGIVVELCCDYLVGIRWRIRIPLSGGAAEIKNWPRKAFNTSIKATKSYIGCYNLSPCWRLGVWLQPENSQGKSGSSRYAAVDPPIRSTTGINLPPSICTRRLDGFATDGITSARRSEQVRSRGGGAWWRGDGVWP
ncbi:hypothetical protein F511_41835 [Dorcoceras hygrometricum]|uniref:Uncharacterized protein n=1 Tax=Dorcoceras hygrometricum TaxID=472368 RepID=A0A2Z7C901_9LAMI|nr:hypothetical protein F511_41835 [Dorcoceras hygrometricum]